MSTNNAGGSASPAQLAQAALQDFRAEAEAVADLKLKSKAASIRKLRPGVESLNKLGFSQEKIVEVMTEAGIEITVPVLKSMLWRLRKEDPASE